MDTETRYNLALDYLYSFVDYSLKRADQLAAAHFDLARMRQLLARLGQPQEAYPTIHVAGTKGKGSVSALCASALTASGRKTGLYTSPHLLDFCERIQVNGQPIAHADLADLVEEIKPAVAAIPQLTTFEITTALGFLYFARQRVDAAVIEVGLGGRLDATNVITPRVSVITSLSYDHTAVLGNTLAKIAAEKAGIIKPGVPVISSPQKQEALQVLERVAAEQHAELSLVGIDWLYAPESNSLEGQTFRVWQAGMPHLRLKIPLLGEYQVTNAVTAYAALKHSGFNLTDAAIAQGFENVRWPCRFEVASRAQPTLIFDSAHNQDSFEKLTAALKTYFPDRKIILLFGASEDKHIFDMLNAMKGIISRLIITRADHPRALEPETILEAARRAELLYETVTPVQAALHRALELAATTDDVIVSAGSMFVTAEVVNAWKNRRNNG
ncbi:MAG: bifunctional folylpolyglutamate synthase/dihydrofolate synthase [Anaerolineales bacterium]|nr:bifunctional folylpolyglutamate synthase/dihydrofolate synthase [Anaerolineales bacterium]MCX7753830.1 bifunctional folylpolyglutamate synthase/dihydrofolate synthase [Anaerolineales bacterium]MDW8276426.1 folylpolyglutamate synthase/dihydrofolate synthase family protein [Anaerolineales bacterium]